MFYKWSETGLYHRNNNDDNQDVILINDNQDCKVATVCDGVSSCKHAREGAEIAGNSILWLFSNMHEKLLNYDEKTVAEKTINHICHDLEKVANANSQEIEEYSSTVSCALYDKKKNKLLCINVGDAIIGAVSKTCVEIIGKPQKGRNGCYATTTMGVEKTADVFFLDAKEYESVFICSDGMWSTFFDGREIDKNVAERIRKKQYDDLVKDVKMKPCYDDRSIVVMEILGGE